MNLPNITGMGSLNNTLSSLPQETLFNILVNLCYSDIIKYCATNKGAKSICDTDYFWQQKAYVDFRITAKEFSQSKLNARLRYIELLTNIGNVCVPGSEQFVSSDLCLRRASV